MPFLAYLTMAAVFIAAPIIVQATPRHDELLCEEVAAVLNEAVAYGTITQSVADEVSDDCYTYYPSFNV